MVALIGAVEPIVRWALERPVRTAVSLAILWVLCLWLVCQPSFFKTDPSFVTLAPDYEPQVLSLVAGEGFGSFRYPPVLPLMLAGLELASAATGIDDGWLGALLLLAFAISGSVLVFLLGERLWGSRWGLLCVVVWLAYPIFWRLWLQPLSEAPFTALLLGAVLLVLRSTEQGNRGSWCSLFTGSVLGLGMLTRPSGIGLPIVFGLFALTGLRGLSLRRRSVSAALVILGATLTILPWEVYSWRSTGEIIPLSTGGVPTLLDGLTYAVDPSENRPVWVPDGVRELQREIYEKSYLELDRISSIARFLLEKLGDRPSAVFQMFAIKMARAWYGTDSGVVDKWLLALQIPAVVLLLIGTAKTWNCSGPARDAGVLIVMIVLYFWAMTTAVLSIARYMVPALALMVVTLPALGQRTTGPAWSRSGQSGVSETC